MAADENTLVPLCKTAEVEPGAVKRVDVEGFPPLAVFNLDGSYFVLDDTCSHGQASLSEGYVEGDEIECPWHSGRFCIRDGQAKSFPVVVPVKSYSVTLVGDDVCIPSTTDAS